MSRLGNYSCTQLPRLLEVFENEYSFISSPNILTFNYVGAVVEDQGENVVDGSVGVQGVGVLVVAHKAVLAAQDQHGPVDELHQEQLVVTCDRNGARRPKKTWSECGVGGALDLNRRQLTRGVADCRELPVLLCAHVLAVAGFEGHSVSSPLDVKLCVHLSDGGREGYLRFRWRFWKPCEGREKLNVCLRPQYSLLKL